MNLKTFIKNNLWQWNYIVPFVKKYRQDGGKLELIGKILGCYANMRPVKGAGDSAGGKRSVGRDTKALLETIETELPENSRFIYFIDTKKTLAVHGNVLSNFTLDYDRIVHGTFAGLAQRASGDDEYGREAHAVADGIEALAQRIARMIQASDMPEPIKSRRADDFANMLSRPAEHFEEALQRILFFNQILWQTRHRLNGLGRLDHMLADLYSDDISSGCLTREEALDIISDFMSQLSRYPEYKSDALMGDIGQIIILGGLEADGCYFHNELTALFMQAQAGLRKPDPKILLRVSRSMPDDLLRLAVECLKARTGSPLFSNDDVVIPALLDFGMPAEDAYAYCTSACWEPFIAGKSLDQNNIAVYDFFPPLDKVLRRDSAYESFEALLDAYIGENNSQFAAFLKGLDAFRWAKDPLVSMFTDHCSGARRDISEGSANYNNYGVTTVALSNTVDSLLNIRYLVFDSRQYTLAELESIRRSNFDGQEALLERLRRHKSFGHDTQAAVALTQRVTAQVAELAKGYRNGFGGTVKFGLSSPGYNMLSRHTAADYSGRRQGMPYNTHISCTNAACTELVGFASQLQYGDQRFNGNVVDFFLPGQFLADNADKFLIFLKGAIHRGFFQMQMNIMDSATLIDAKAHPENYAGLIVRVWGFSAYFNDLPESYKDLLIERALAAERVA